MKNVVLISFILFFLPFYSISQGCSDAGFCSTGDLNHTSSKNLFFNQPKAALVISNIIGIGERNTFYYSLETSTNFLLSDNYQLQFKIPYHFITGDLANNHGLGDLMLNISRTFSFSDSVKLSVVLGGKIPSNSANDSYEQNPLPMAYQASLGTYDIILGSSLKYNNWFVALGYQKALNENKNEFLNTSWPNNEAEGYFSSYKLRRGDDIMLRINRIVQFEKTELSFGILPIYRLQKDEIQVNGQTQSLDKSDGLTLNLNAAFSFYDKKNGAYRLSFGVPTITKDVRPDGLTRSFVLSFDYRINF